MTSFLWYLVIVPVLVAALLGISALLGERHRERTTDEPYESGIPPSGDARTPHVARFYLIAIAFVIFDLEAAFLFAWAVSLREAGLAGYVGALVFIAILLVGLAYEWRSGAFDWVRVGRERREAGLEEKEPAR